MQEIAILLSSLAGACTAAAVKKFPKGKHTISTLGTNAHIKNQINSLKLEKEILTKTISRLYQHESELSKTQRDRLLLKYQHQLGVVLAKIEKLEEASKHPDLGPLGEGLVTLMDQKLSTLDKRLYELSSKINLANTQTFEIKHEQQISEKRKKQIELVEHTSVIPQVEQPKIESSQEQSSSPSVVKKPTPKVTLPEDEKEDEDEDDLDKIKGEIMKTLSKLEQAEVE